MVSSTGVTELPLVSTGKAYGVPMIVGADGQRYLVGQAQPGDVPSAGVAAALVHSGGTCELLQDNFTGPVLLLAPTVLLPLLAHALGAGWPAALLIGLPIGAAISFGVLVVGIGCAGG